MEDQKEADYRLLMFWREGQWRSYLSRSDSAYLFDEDSVDFSQIVRDGCRAMLEDTKYPAPIPAGQQGPQSHEVDRYELRDVRNGAVTSSAILDKKTGKVWIWNNVTDEKGRKTGKSAFVSEEVSPEPDNR
jgi:hypothetical protein